MSFKLTENEVYKYLGLAVIILAVIFIIHKIVEIQSRVIEGMTNNDPHGKSINELIDEIKKVAQNKRNDLHITEDREKLEDIIFSYKSIIGCDVLKDMSTNRDNENNSELLMNKLVGYNNSMDGLDKLMNQLDRFENRVKKDESF